MLTYLIGGGVGGQEGAFAPQTKIGGHPPPPPLHVLVPKNAIADVFDNNFDISAHIFCLQTTQEFPKKHNEAGTPEQQPTDALSQIDYGHNGHCENCLCQRTTQRAFWKI